jgi:ADP-dependent phosphofructokinase/glucokinase
VKGERQDIAALLGEIDQKRLGGRAGIAALRCKELDNDRSVCRISKASKTQQSGNGEQNGGFHVSVPEVDASESRSFGGR